MENYLEEILAFVTNCEKCEQGKILMHTLGKSVITTTPIKPFDVVCIDTMGPLPKTPKTKRYIEIMQCELTKYIVLITTQNKEVNSIARAMVENFILKYGKFLEMKSDQALENSNETLKKIANILEIKQMIATAFHQQIIGSLKRNHRALNEFLLRAFTNVHYDDRDDWVKFY